MPTFKFTAPDGKQYSVNGPDGATEQQAFQMLQTQMGTPAAAPEAAPAPAKPFGAQLNDAIKDVPRQLGLTARYGLEGLGGMANLVASPVRAGLNAILPQSGGGIAGQITGAPKRDAIQPMNFEGIADSIGLPKPRTAGERVIGDASRMVAGGLVPIGAGAGLAKVASGATQAVGRALAANPAQQLASAGSAGAAGGYTRETGGDDMSQFAASLAAGVASPFAISKAQQAATAAGRMARGTAVPTPQQLDITINAAMQGGGAQGGVAFGDLAAGIQSGIRRDVADAYRLTGSVTPDAIRRLADYRLTGTNPTAATLTLDPAIVSQQKNLAKQGINSKDLAAQALGQTENQNNRQLIGEMNRLGAATPDTPIVGGRRIIAALGDREERARTLIGGRYNDARATGGRPVDLDPHAFTTQANNLLDEAMVGGKLPIDVRNRLNAIASGDHPLNVDIAEQFKTRIGDLQRSSQDGQERLALGMVRRALDDAPLLNDGAGLGAESIRSFNRARRLNRAWEGIVERTPALAAVRDGIEPDKFVQRFIVGSGATANTADLAALQRSVRRSPDAAAAVREQIAAHLKAKALNGATDEVGNISQSSYNKALREIGDEKLGMFFTRPEVNQLRAIGRVASYEQFQPRGSAVGNSNTGAVVLSSVFDRIANSPLLSKIPFGNTLSQPMQNIAIGINAGRALNVPNALAAPRLTPPRQPVGLLMSPAILMGGEDDKKPRGLLSP